jgi:hypothetical protein
MTANAYQPGGSHYNVQGTLQHWDLCERYGIGYLESAATKYIFRHRSKSGALDLQKALHYTEKLLELATEGYETYETYFFMRFKYQTTRKPRGRVPQEVYRQWVLDEKIPELEAHAMGWLFTWRTPEDLKRATRLIKQLLATSYPSHTF